MTDVGLLGETILVLGFAFGFIVIGYEEEAARRGWPVGAWLTGASFMKLFALLVAAGAIVLSLIVTPWWYVFVTLVGGFVIAFALSQIFRAWVQGVALIGCVLCFLAAPFALM